MNVPQLKLAGLSKVVVEDFRATNALVEVTESRANGLVARNLRVVFGNLDLTAYTPEEIQRIAEQNGPGLFLAGDDPDNPVMPPEPTTMSRSKFEALPAVDRMAWVKAGKQVTDD